MHRGLFFFVFCLNLLKNKYIFDGRMYYVQLRSEEEYLQEKRRKLIPAYVYIKGYREGI